MEHSNCSFVGINETTTFWQRSNQVSASTQAIVSLTSNSIVFEVAAFASDILREVIHIGDSTSLSHGSFTGLSTHVTYFSGMESVGMISQQRPSNYLDFPKSEFF
ncbi:hypothetical protein J6590_061039 [Homalodisca vitripennis]|nr:hypothetical protein J6590_061039 [Homalodisca vitripennis]